VKDKTYFKCQTKGHLVGAHDGQKGHKGGNVETVCHIMEGMSYKTPSKALRAMQGYLNARFKSIVL